MRLRTIDIGGPVQVAELGGAGRPVVLLHGLGGAHENWVQVGERLARYGRVLALDMPGFGRTPPAGRSASVRGQLEVLQAFLDQLAPDGPALLVGNSMGGAVALLEAARRPERVAGLVLVDPALPPPPRGFFDPSMVITYALCSVPGLGELARKLRAKRLGPEGHVRQLIGSCCGEGSSVPEDIIQLHITLAREQFERMPWIDGAYLQGMRSLVTLLLRDREYRESPERITAPTLLLHGAADPVVPVAASRALATRRPDWTYVELAGLGHIPQMENPDVFLGALEPWLAGPGRAALASAPALPGRRELRTSPRGQG